VASSLFLLAAQCRKKRAHSVGYPSWIRTVIAGTDVLMVSRGNFWNWV